jgi:hypothetical protein
MGWRRPCCRNAFPKVIHSPIRSSRWQKPGRGFRASGFCFSKPVDPSFGRVFFLAVTQERFVRRVLGFTCPISRQRLRNPAPLNRGVIGADSARLATSGCKAVSAIVVGPEDLFVVLAFLGKAERLDAFNENFASRRIRIVDQLHHLGNVVCERHSVGIGRLLRPR